MPTCTVCGGKKFSHTPVLWDSLVAQWQLTPEEADYIDRQQGTSCTICGANLRSVALANAIRAHARTQLTLSDYISSPAAQNTRLLEINEAGSLGPILRRAAHHVLANYPDVDMHALPYADASFDFVVHSDTLEHLAHPVRALAECRRVLKPGGALCFTVPTVVGRLTRSRAGLPKSYHGAPGTGLDDFLVHTEFGADFWIYVAKAGFTAVAIYCVEFPCALAIAAART